MAQEEFRPIEVRSGRKGARRTIPVLVRKRRAGEIVPPAPVVAVPPPAPVLDIGGGKTEIHAAYLTSYNTVVDWSLHGPPVPAPPSAPPASPASTHRPLVEVPLEAMLDSLLDDYATPEPAPGPTTLPAYTTPAEISLIEEAIEVSEKLDELKRLREKAAHEAQLQFEREERKRARVTAIAAQVPEVNQAAVDAITRLLMRGSDAKKPPFKTAHLLAIICKLHEQKKPFPVREAVAEKIGSALSTIDAALSARIFEGYISARMETREGNVDKEKRESIIREKYYDPSDELFRVYRDPYPKERAVRAPLEKPRHNKW